MSLFSDFLGLWRKKKEEKKPEVREYEEKPRFERKPIKRREFDEVTEARQRAREIVLEAKDEALAIRRRVEEETQRLRDSINKLEQTAGQKEERLERRLGAVEERERQVETRSKEIETKIAEAENIKKEQIKKLEKIAELTRDEAKKLIMAATENYLTEDIAKRIKAAEEKAKEESDKKAKDILIDSMRHGATDYVAEYSVSVVKLADEEMKGRIIGKEGRNIRALEKATGVDFEIDETPGEIRLSSFDSVRREIARLSLERLMKDGRIQPGRIEEIVVRTKEDIEKIMFEEGEKLAQSVGVYNLPADKLKLLGRFKYRFSYGQNMISHTLEETKIGVALAHNVNANVNVVRLGCLLHDIGKVITEEEGSHVQLAVDLLKKNGMPEEVIACVAEHHEDKPFSSVESVLVYIADAISGSRPGARYEDYEEYVKRLTELEEIAKSFSGVTDVYAFQAGRELRVIVNPEEMNDAKATKLALDIKKEIEEKVKHFPGQIKITVIREKRITETAK